MTSGFDGAVIGTLLTKLKQRAGSCSGSVGSLGINAPLALLRTRGNLLTASCVDLFTVAIFVSSAPSTHPRFELRVAALKLMPQLDALWFADNAFATFAKTPAGVEVSVAVLFAWFAELCPMRKLTIFYADDEPS